MSKLRIHNFAMSLDGYGAGPSQGLGNPLGSGGEALHEWMFPTRAFKQMLGVEGGATGIDDDFAARGFVNLGAWILGPTCSGLFGGIGQTTRGKAGGATTRRTTRLFSF